MEWYDGFGVHGSMWGVFVPPGLSLEKDRPMGTLWDKRIVDATHASHTLTSRHIHKALTHPLMLPKDDHAYKLLTRDKFFNVAGKKTH
jgi:hypothetical protein